MKVAKLVIALGLPVIALNAPLAEARTERNAVRACSNAIVETFQKQQDVELGLNVDESGIKPLNRLNRFTTFELDAIDSNTRNIIGKFTCTVDRSAQVKRLVTLPMSAKKATQRSRG